MKVVTIGFVLLNIVFLIAGCAHDHAALTPEGELVQEIDPDAAKDCKFIDHVEAFFGSDSDSDALITLRNKIGVAGGNAYVHPTFSDNPSVTEAKADAYKCPPK